MSDHPDILCKCGHSTDAHFYGPSNNDYSPCRQCGCEDWTPAKPVPDHPDIPALVARLHSLYRRATEIFDESLAYKLRNVSTKTDERVLSYWVDDARKDATIGIDALAIRDAAAALSGLTRALAERDAYITQCENMIRRHAEAAAIFQPGGRYAGVLLLGRDSVVEGIAWLTAALDERSAWLAECYKLTGADPDGDEDWRLAPDAVEEVRRFRRDYDDLDSQLMQSHAELSIALRERDEALAALARYEADHAKTRP